MGRSKRGVLLGYPALDAHRRVDIASPIHLAVVRMHAADQSQGAVAVLPQAPREGPFSLAFGTGTSERQNLFVTSSGAVGALVPGTWPAPGLVKLEIGIPGLPLP